MKVALTIPTYNAGSDFSEVLSKIKQQSINIDLLKVIDSSSTNDTIEIANNFGFEVEIIPKETFSHGGTRTKIAKELKDKRFDYIIFMSQDVHLQENSLLNIINFIKNDKNLGVVYGKQEVSESIGNKFEYFSRSFNYGEESNIKTKHDIEKFGIKTIFSSDAFAIYNLRIIDELGYFGYTADVSEDMLIADKIISSNYKVGYCAEAKVYHTHNYSLKEEYERYKKIGFFYKQNKELVNKYGKTNKNGLKLVIGEIVFLTKKGYIYLVPQSLLRNAAKFLGHNIGKRV